MPTLPPQEIEHLYAAGWAALQSNRLSEAEEAFLAVLTHDQNHVDALNGLGAVYFQERRLDEAEHLYGKALEVGLAFYGGKMPDHVDWEAPHDRALLRTLHGRALVTFRKGDAVKAEERFEEILRIDPDDHVGARYLLDDIAEGRGSWDEGETEE